MGRHSCGTDCKINWAADPRFHLVMMSAISGSRPSAACRRPAPGVPSGCFFVGRSFGEFGEQLVGFLLFSKGLFEQPRRTPYAELLGPGSQRAIAGDFVMLHRLCGGDQ